MISLSILQCVAMCLMLAPSPSCGILSGSDNSTNVAAIASNRTSSIEPDLNTTFYYEADAFLINKNKNAIAASGVGNQKELVAVPDRPAVRPASIAMTSGRNGRMMDLDALVGDFEASQANKERTQTGNRQSRFLPNQMMDLGAGKKLHIQGFIPIVGVKDSTDDDEAPEADIASGHKGTANNHKARAQTQQQMSELPYAQSSMGHATFGVHRYLNSEQPAPMMLDTVYSHPPQQHQHQSSHTDTAKYSSSSVVETLKKPIKKLTSYVASDSHSTPTNPPTNSLQHQQNCLCVPFYMCKNGYISESSLGKSQIQQMIQQQMQYPKPTDGVEMKSIQPVIVTQRPAIEMPQTVPYNDAYAPVDERSFDQELVTMSSLSSNFNASQQDAAPSTGSESAQVDEKPQVSAEDVISNGTDIGNTEYSQDILGRMLGIKSSSSRTTSASSTTGVCGLLRTCCNIPIQLYPSQHDMAYEKSISINQQSNKILQQQLLQQQQQQQQLQLQQSKGSVYSPNQSDLMHMQQAQQVVAVQRYQPQVPMPSSLLQHQTQQRLPYGFPAQTLRSSPVNNYNAPIENSLSHRSNQLQQISTRYPQPSIQVSQFTRAAPQAHQMQLFQPQQQSSQAHQQQAKAMQPIPMSLTQLQSQQAFSSAVRNPPANIPASLLGTRKILDGRCGLRQAAGITGRVQNLQYHESSADFGEYPAQAAILKRLPGSDSLFVCGGTLISQYWVATAAHCIKKYAQSDLKVRLGEWDVHRDDEFYPFVEKEVRDLVVHPDFVAGNLVNDIALLRLDTPVDPTLPHVNPACLPTIDETFTRQQCSVTGWGKDSFGQKGSFQAVLREVELPVVGHGECESALRQTRLGPHYRLHNGFICAGGEGGKDACEGDGGSGLYCSQDGVIKVVGLVSWGIGCGQAGIPGVYVNLAHYRPWIENIISIDEDIYSPYSNMIGNSLISERSNFNATTTTTIVTTTTKPTTTTITSENAPIN